MPISLETLVNLLNKDLELEQEHAMDLKQALWI